ncbi:MAG: Ig-like domain-containing protein [Chromatiales bacterium]|nr:Ig-like domain-containing protein [Chromatiales bacterium]
MFDGDGRSGLWLAHDDRLRHLQADGSIGYDLELAQIGHAGPIDALAADPRDASVWIGIDGWLLHLDPSGNLLHQQALPSQSTVHALGLYADTWPPTLAIVEPPDQSHLDTSAVPLLVIYDDPGRGIDPDTLSFERDGTPHPAACSHSGNLAQCLVDLPEGSHRLTARIADRAGNASPDVSIDVTVDTTPPAIPNLVLIEIGDPAGGIVSIIGKAGSVEAGTRVQVTNDRSGERVTVQADSLGRFQLTIGAREGDVLHIRATDTAGNTGAPASFTVTSEASGGNDGTGGGGGGGTGGGGNDGGSNDGVGSDPGDDDPPPTDDADSGGGTVPYAVEIDHPTSGAIVPPFVSVTGRHAGPANTGIVVNGKAALVDQDGRFIANDVDVPDSGLIHVVARTFEGETVTVEVRTQPTATPPSFAIIADADGGVAPFTTGFRLISPANVEIAEATIDFDGDGVADDDLFDLEDIFEYTFEQPGIHRVSMTIRMASGDTHHVDTAILVVDPVRLDTMLRELWDEMNQALIDGDTARALEFVSYRSRARYEPIFEALKEHFADIVASYSEPITVTLSPGMAEYAINRIIDGEDYIFLIYLMKDAWGVWRVTEM